MEHKNLFLSDCQIKLDDKGRFGGYASTFGNVDSYGDTILSGAYKDTLKKDGLPKMFLQHDSQSLPIGKWLEASEDEKGLYMVGEFTPGMPAADSAKAALLHETVDGLSIGYMLRKGDYKPSDKQEGGRIIERISSLKEVSLVTFPADSFARIDMKSEIDELETIRDIEHFLRDAGGFSKSTVLMLISKFKSIIGEQKSEYSPITAKIDEICNKLNQYR